MDKIELPLRKNEEIMMSTLFFMRDENVLPMMS